MKIVLANFFMHIILEIFMQFLSTKSHLNTENGSPPIVIPHILEEIHIKTAKPWQNVTKPSSKPNKMSRFNPTDEVLTFDRSDYVEIPAIKV